MGARIAFGKIKGLHRHFKQHLVTGLAREIDSRLRIEGERHEAERHRRGQPRERELGVAGTDVETADNDCDAGALVVRS